MATDSANAVNAGDVVQFGVQGSTLTLTVNGTVYLTVTDGNITQIGQPGLHSEYSGVTYDNYIISQ